MKARHHTTNSIAAELEPEAISHPQKVFWPDESHTKLDLAKFYEEIFPALQPYVAHRLATSHCSQAYLICSSNALSPDL